MFENAGKCLKMQENVRKCWKILENSIPLNCVSFCSLKKIFTNKSEFNFHHDGLHCSSVYATVKKLLEPRYKYMASTACEDLSFSEIIYLYIYIHLFYF
jgi:hypothetical protein